jgi:hypothetical protein
MVIIETKKIQQIGNSNGIVIPEKWLHARRRFLNKGDVLDLVILEDAIVIVDRGTDFDDPHIIGGLKEAQRMWNVKEDSKQLRCLNKLSPEEQEKIRKSWKETEADLTGKFDDSKSVNM